MKFRRALLISLCWGVVALAVVSCGATPVKTKVSVNGSAMDPNFKNGDVVTIEPVNLVDLKRGDVIYFDRGVHWLKRVIGLPKEKVEIRDGKVWINDQPLDEPYTLEPMLPFKKYGPITLKDDEYFVLGDNRNFSNDSATYGPITGDEIQGRVAP